MKNKKDLNLKRLKKNVKGITLIALVVTVIVLLILAGVALSLTVGDNGLFRRAQNAADTWQMAEQNEQSEIEQAGNFLDDYTSEYNKATTVAYAKQLNKAFEKNTLIKDDLGNEVMIPAGFKIASDSATLVENGIVIEDSDENQFVWIPSRTEDKGGAIIKLFSGETTTIIYKRTVYSTNIDSGEIDEETNSEKIIQSSTIDHYYTEAMPTDEVESINENGGYYIGRYEAGDKESTEAKTMRRGSITSQENTITIKKDQTPYDRITYTNAKKKAEEMDTVQGYTTATTKLVSSYAWDTAISFIQISNSDYGNNSPEGNYLNTKFDYIDITGVEQTKNSGEGTLVPTGQTTAVSNIYDMGGNAWEFTTESYSNVDYVYSARGSDWHNNYDSRPAGFRGSADGLSYNNGAFRVTLYLK